MLAFSLPKIDGVSTQPAAEMNSVFNELDNIITKSGIALNGSDNDQLSKAVAIYAAGGAYYIDSGSATAYVLTPVGLKKSPPVLFDGMWAMFLPATTNTTTTPTVAVGGLPATEIVWDAADTPLLKGVIQVNKLCIVQYNLAIEKFVLITRPTSIYAEIIGHKVVTGGAAIAKMTDIDSVYDPFGIWNVTDKRFEPKILGNFVFGVHPAFNPDANNSTFTFNQYVNGVADDVYFAGQVSNTTRVEWGDGSQPCLITNVDDYIELYIESSVGGFNADFISYRAEFKGDFT